MRPVFTARAKQTRAGGNFDKERAAGVCVDGAGGDATKWQIRMGLVEWKRQLRLSLVEPDWMPAAELPILGYRVKS